MLANRYRLVRRIASGGMGTVHEGVDERLGRRVAVKILKEEYADDPSFVERFSREARAAAALGHPHIVQVFDTGQDGNRHFIVMEFVVGQHLGDLLQEEHRLAPERAVGLVTQVCSALAMAHAAGIVHRDIKAGNVLVDSDDAVKVTDFGIAQTRGQAALTGTGTVLGTAQYLSPEQASGQVATPASDLYSVGILLFQMLTGRLPFEGDTPVAVALRHVREEVPSVRDLAPDVPRALAAVVARATAKDPEQRFADAHQMEGALRDALVAPDAVPATAMLPAPTATGDGVPGSSRGRLAAVLGRRGLVAAGVVLVGAVLLGWLALPDGSSPQADLAGPAPSHRPTMESSPPRASRDRADTTAPTPTPSSRPTTSAPLMPEGVIGMDGKDLEDRFKAAGYDVHKVDLDSSAPTGQVVGTFPSPDQPLTQHDVVLVVSDGKAPEQQTQYAVPRGVVGGEAKEVEQRLKDDHIEVKKVGVHSTRPKDTVIGTYPAEGANADAGTVVLVLSTGE